MGTQGQMGVKGGLGVQKSWLRSSLIPLAEHLFFFFFFSALKGISGSGLSVAGKIVKVSIRR